MPDRSPHEGLPEDWNHGSHARGPFSTADASDGYGAGTTGSHRARSTDGYGTADAYGAAGAAGAAAFDALGTRADSYGAAKADAFGIRPTETYGAGAAEPFGDADPFGPRDADPFGPRDADPFGPRAGDPFGPRAGDPFGPPGTSAFGTKTAAFAAVTADAGTARPDAERPVTVIGDQAPGQATDPGGFLGALFDFGFTSFVTPKIIRVLYMLIVVGTVLSALVFTIIAFKASVPFGILTLVFGVPLFILIVLAIYRVLLEFFVITFRMAEDVRAMRERDGG
jgi:Domain of unknown function (DUF4282)